MHKPGEIKVGLVVIGAGCTLRLSGHPLIGKLDADHSPRSLPGGFVPASTKLGTARRFQARTWIAIVKELGIVHRLGA